jgi:hypothetical protein
MENDKVCVALKYKKQCMGECVNLCRMTIYSKLNETHQRSEIHCAEGSVLANEQAWHNPLLDTKFICVYFLPEQTVVAII